MENRNGYFYRKVWANGTCYSIYVGMGDDVELMAMQEEQERQAQREEREAWRRLMEREQAVDAGIDDIGAALGALVDAMLLVGGYRQHNRGEWRKQRDK